MAYRWLTELADVARSTGYPVVEIDGWKTRGRTSTFGRPVFMEEPTGILLHHTAGPRYVTGGPNYPSLRIVRDGRTDLPGPLAQLGLGFDGTIYVIAAGIAYHAGPTKDYTYRNERCIGIEAENPGDGSPWPERQYAAYVALVAALVRAYPGTVGHVQGHKEQTAGKIDPTFDMPRFRADLGVALGAPPAPVVPADQDLGKWMTVEQVKAVQAWLGVTVDGIAGPDTIKALQTRLGTPADGVISGPASQVVEALQKFVGAPVDGILGPDTAAKLTAYITAHVAPVAPPPPKPTPKPVSRDEPRPKPIPTVVLRKGDVSKDVTKLQTSINAWTKAHEWRLRLDVDGRFGDLTEYAVRALQRGAGIAVDGIVGRDTWTALRVYL